MTTGFIVPNTPDVLYTDMAEPDAGDFQILQGDLYGVLSGCVVTAQASANMTVNLAAGVAVVQGAPVAVAAQQVPPTGSFGAPGANARFDLVVVNSAGVASVIPGSAADANPRFPTIPDGYTVVASVYINVGIGSITSPLLTDKRVMLDASFRRLYPTAATTAVSLRAQSDSTVGLTIRADGQMSWLGGATLADMGTNLMRWSGGVTFQSLTNAVVPLRTQALSGQTAHQFDVLDPNGTAVGYVDANGRAFWANFKFGTGDPNGTTAGFVGDLYVRRDGAQDSILYAKESYSSSNPTTGWYPFRRVDPGSTTSNVPIGGMVMYAGGSIPAGWLLCDGSPISRGGIYAALFNAISTTWGPGDGSSTFNLPNFSGRTAVGTGSGAGLSTRAVGQTGGAETVALSTTQMPSHVHIMNAHDHGVLTGGTDATHYHAAYGNGRTLFTGDADLTHDHQDGQHVHYGLGGLAKFLTETDVPPGTANALSVIAGPQQFTWSNTTGGNLTPTRTSTALGTHSHGLGGNTSDPSNDHHHGISPATPTMQSAGTGSAHENMPPWAAVPFIIRYA